MKRFFLPVLAPVAVILTMIFTGATQAGSFRHHVGHHSGHHTVYTQSNSGGYGGYGHGYRQGGFSGGYGNGYQQRGFYGNGYGQSHHHH